MDNMPAPLLSIPLPGIGKTFEILPSVSNVLGASLSSSSSSGWNPGPNGMSKEKKDAAKAKKKLLKKLRKRGKQHR